MMRKMFISVLSVFFLLNVSGISAQSTPDDDLLIRKLVDKLQAFPRNEKSIIELKDAYDRACKADQERTMALKSSGQPDIWYEIYKLYDKQNKRQKFVMQLPDGTLKKAGFVFSDYEKDLKDSKFNAAAYLYALAAKLLNEGTPIGAKNAYDELILLSGLFNEYRDMDKLLRQAIIIGAANIRFELYNRTGKQLNEKIIDQLSTVVWDYKKERFGQLKPAQPDSNFNFTLRIVLNELDVTSDQTKEKQYAEERDIYNNGIVVDTIQCQVSETSQFKKASLKGSLDLVENQSGQVVNRIPVNVESVFRNSYGYIQGNPDACGDETRALLQRKKMAYPSSEQLILDAVAEFSKKSAEILIGGSQE